MAGNQHARSSSRLEAANPRPSSDDPCRKPGVAPRDKSSRRVLRYNHSALNALTFAQARGQYGAEISAAVVHARTRHREHRFQKPVLYPEQHTLDAFVQVRK